jgi:predicted ribosome quality control (RQC) complex YloA/Tae2 family protein
VVVRKSKKEPLPYRSLVEAAEIAAYFSQARHSGKVVVNYTERKYVHKIRGAAPGLVRLADFKSITVEPRIRATRIDI